MPSYSNEDFGFTANDDVKEGKGPSHWRCQHDARDRVIGAIAQHKIIFAKPGDRDRVMVVARPHVQEIVATSLGVPQHYVGTNDQIADWLVSRGFTEDGSDLRLEIDRRRRPLVEGAVAPSADVARELDDFRALEKTPAYTSLVREIARTALAEAQSPDEALAEVKGLAGSPALLIDMGEDALQQAPGRATELKNSLQSDEAMRIVGHRLATDAARDIEALAEVWRLAEHLNKSAHELMSEYRLGNIESDEYEEELELWYAEMTSVAKAAGVRVDIPRGPVFRANVLWKG